MNKYQPNFAEICGHHKNIEEYGRFQQHLGLLEDTMRVGAYHAAIKASADSRRRVAVDVGGGSGVLTLCALKNGYEKVYYIEPSRKIAHYAAYNCDRHGVFNKVVVLNNGLEDIDLTIIKEPIDLIVTETISTLFVGFGCWPKFNALRERLSPIGTIVPFAGQVHGFLAAKDMATRNDGNHGLKLLRDVGIDVDIYKRSFRSGGNVFDKGSVNFHIVSNEPQTRSFVEIDAKAKEFCREIPADLTIAESDTKTGLLTYWRLRLSEFNSVIVLDSRDPRLTSWSPYYIPFSTPLKFDAGDKARMRIRTLLCDAPYLYAFQLFNRDDAISEVLYW